MTRKISTIKIKRTSKIILVLLCLLLAFSALASAIPDKYIPEPIKPVTAVLKSILPMVVGSVLLFVGIALLPTIPFAGAACLIAAGALLYIGVSVLTNGFSSSTLGNNM